MKCILLRIHDTQIGWKVKEFRKFPLFDRSIRNSVRVFACCMKLGFHLNFQCFTDTTRKRNMQMSFSSRVLPCCLYNDMDKYCVKLLTSENFRFKVVSS